MTTTNNKQLKIQPGRNTIIGKHQLIIIARGEKEIASQLFNYDDMREIRLSLTDLEVRVLMNYDESYHRVFKISLKDNSADERAKAEQAVLKFYNDLTSASMKFTKEEIDNLQKQHQAQLEANTKKEN